MRGLVSHCLPDWNKVGAILAVMFLALSLGGCSAGTSGSSPGTTPSPFDVRVGLPEPKLGGDMSLEAALFKRRSARDYSGEALRLVEVSQLLWAGQGITSELGGRTAPSAGGLYPLTIYLAAGAVTDLAPGAYKYDPDRHELSKVKGGDLRNAIAAASLDQPWVKNCAASLVLSANYEKTTAKYGDRGIRYVQLEAGHVAQNICLQATALNLGAVTVGAFDDARIKEILGIPANESPLYIIPIGRVGD